MGFKKQLAKVWDAAQNYSVKWATKPITLRKRIKVAKRYVGSLLRAADMPPEIVVEMCSTKSFQYRCFNEVLKAARYWADHGDANSAKLHRAIEQVDNYVEDLRIDAWVDANWKIRHGGK